MGCGASTTQDVTTPRTQKTMDKKPKGFQMIPDRFTSYSQVTSALRHAGLESSQLVVGIDFTKSNKWTGAQSFGGRCLHDLDSKQPNPYQQVLQIIATTLAEFDDDGMIPAYGFGDSRTKSSQVFSFNEDDTPCVGLGDVLKRYEAIVANAIFSGPTNFAPMIRHATELVRRTQEYHILLLIADGQVDSVNDTVDAIVEASKYALSIVMIGVGDGPWDLMEQFDDLLPQRKFDNFQFVDFNSVFSKSKGQSCQFAFAVHALMEIPEQYEFVKSAGMIGSSSTPRSMPHRAWQRPLGPPPKSSQGLEKIPQEIPTGRYGAYTGTYSEPEEEANPNEEYLDTE